MKERDRLGSLTTDLAGLAWVIPAAIWVLVVFGCDSRAKMPAWPPFAMTIPDDVPEAITVVDKDGTSHPANGKELYADGYRSGWKRCAYDYQHDLLDLTSDQIEPPPLGHYTIVVRGWNDGYRSCWKAIREEKAPR
jgi:hypothetical protein